MVESKLVWKDGKCMTFDEHEGKMFMLCPYVFEYEIAPGFWELVRIWCDEYEQVRSEAAKRAADEGTGKWLIYEPMWPGLKRDETGMLHISRAEWRKTGNDFKCKYSDYDGIHPELKGRWTYMPPLSLGYTTCLLIEGLHFVIDD